MHFIYYVSHLVKKNRWSQVPEVILSRSGLVQEQQGDYWVALRQFEALSITKSDPLYSRYAAVIAYSYTD